MAQNLDNSLDNYSDSTIGLSSSKAPLAIIAGGGTGGHIYPGIAIARALNQLGVRVEFVGTSQGLEKKIVPREGYTLHPIASGKLNRHGGVLDKVKSLLQIPLGMIQSLLLIRMRRPQIVLGVGGYASGPFVLMASFMKTRTYLWEPNAFPGLTNRWLSRFVERCFVVFDSATAHLHNKNVTRVGLPVRPEIENISVSDPTDGNRSDNRAGNSEKNDPFRILIFGGSQGSTFINNICSEMFIEGPKNNTCLEVIHQTGPHDLVRIQEAYAKLGSQFQAKEFLFDMDKMYSWADLVICRSGASTVAELAAVGKAAILIPLPTSADDHQKKNALALEQGQSAKMLEQKDLTPKVLQREIQYLISNPQIRNEYSKNIRRFFVPKAAQLLAEQLL